RSTLYTAEPLKETYSTQDSRPTRQQPIAACADPVAAERLRALHFTVASTPAGCDLEVGPGAVAPGSTIEELKANLDRASRASFRGGWLKEFCALGWYAVYYAGPLVLLLVLMGIFAPFVSILFRKLSARLATFALAAFAMV